MVPLTLNLVVNLSNGTITEAPGLTFMRKSAAAAATDNFIFVWWNHPNYRRGFISMKEILVINQSGIARYHLTT